MNFEIDEYKDIFNKIKRNVYSSQEQALRKVNKELIVLYWNIGKVILENQEKEGWGSKFIDRLSKDLKEEFPEMKGFSIRNLKNMRRLALEYPNFEFVQAALAQITWYHNITLIEKVKNREVRNWYINKTIENGWSRNVLVHQIEYKLYERQVLSDKTNNFSEKLPQVQSDMAKETLKDPYIFDFISMTEKINERDIENQLVQKITSFLLELGSGFAFIGNQYKLNVGGEEFYLDLLFYHIKLRCYVIIELKTGKFKPEYAGKLNFYLSAVDDVLKTEEDKPSIGIILCKEKNKLVAEYSLKDMTKPIGVAEYKVLHEIPKELRGSIPTVDEIEENITLSGIDIEKN
ncbi:PDDEXK nuclease domain-containing protein [Clostridium sp. DL1XJH146]